MRLIVTRPAEDAGPLGRHLTACGHEVVMAPLLTIRPVSGQPIPKRGYQAVLITSANGARALLGRPELERLRGATAIVVGPASAEAARSAGFNRVEQAGGDVTVLARSAVAKLRPDAGPLLHVSGAVTAGNLLSVLEEDGFEVDRVVVYEAHPINALQDDCAAALAEGRADGVILYSPRTARIWASLVAAAGLAPAALRVVHYCLSENVAISVRNELGAEVDVKVARRPEEASLLELIPPPA